MHIYDFARTATSLTFIPNFFTVATTINCVPSTRAQRVFSPNRRTASSRICFPALASANRRNNLILQFFKTLFSRWEFAVMTPVSVKCFVSSAYKLSTTLLADLVNLVTARSHWCRTTTDFFTGGYRIVNETEHVLEFDVESESGKNQLFAESGDHFV